MQRTLEALIKRADTQTHVSAPHVGLFHPWVRAGDLVQPGDTVGELEVLGRRSRVAVPRSGGVLTVRESMCNLGWSPVDYATALFVLEPASALGHSSLDAAAAEQQQNSLDLGLPANAQPVTASIEGQFYRAPGPDEPMFVNEESVIMPGDVIGLVEVMKFFYEVHFELGGFESGAKVVRVVAQDGAAIEPGDVIIYVVPASA